MPNNKTPIQVLTYETAAEQDVIPFLSNMRAWRRVAGWLALICVVWLIVPVSSIERITGFSFIAYAALIVFMLFIVTSTACLYFMFRAATSEIGPAYAVRHLLLCILLMPIGGLGIFVVTHLVERDLINHRRMVNQQKQDKLSP